MQLALHTKIRVYLNGKLVFKEAKVKMTTHSGLIPTFDVNEGLAGFTEGSPFTAFNVEQVVPADGSNLVAENYMAAPNLQVTLTLLTNTGSSYSSDCKIIDADIEHGVNAETKYVFNATGRSSVWSVVPAQ